MSPPTEQSIADLRRWLLDYGRRSGETAPDFEPVLDELDRRFGASDESTLRMLGDALDILSRLSPDPSTVLAALMLPLALESEALPQSLNDHAPPDVAGLLEQLRTLTHFGRNYLPDDQSRAEGLRRLLMALVADVRVVLVALAWQVARLHAARDADEATRQAVAHETRMIHAPLA